MKADKNKITVNSIEIEIAGTKLTLTLEQVAELKKMLAKAFPEPEVKTVYVPGPERIRDRYVQPPMTWHPDPPRPFKDLEITCIAQNRSYRAQSSIQHPGS